MRKNPLIIFALFLYVVSAVFTPFTFLSAQAKYGRIITKNVPLYKDESLEEILFYLPISYYVSVKGEFTSFYKVEVFSGGDEFAAIDGYVKRDDLYFGDEYVFSPFYGVSVKTAKVTPFYLDIELKNKVRFIFENRTLKIYGKASLDTDENVIYFAEYDGELGYVEEKCLTPFSFTYHPTPLPDLENGKEVPAQNFEGNAENKTVSVLKLCVIVVLSAAVITVLIYSFQPKKSKRNDSYTDL